jgi:hypothetical protein
MRIISTWSVCSAGYTQGEECQCWKLHEVVLWLLTGIINPSKTWYLSLTCLSLGCKRPLSSGHLCCVVNHYSKFPKVIVTRGITAIS